MDEKDEDRLRTIFEEEMPACVRANDIPGYVSHFADEAVWCPSNAVDRYGPIQIAEGLTAALANLTIDPLFTADEVTVMGDFGYVFGRSKETLHPKDGSPTSVVDSRELWLFRKRDGAWKIYRMIWNFKPS
jgi:uncharacterized protein (TIGR02246 family)